MFERKASMKRVLLDTNVILDFLLRREPNYVYAQDMIKEIVHGNAQEYITASMATDVFYLLQKTNGKAFALNSLDDFHSSSFSCSEKFHKQYEKTLK